jgi:chromosome segregation ATPase
MKNLLRDWLGINEEKFAVEVQLNTLQKKLDELDEKYKDADRRIYDLDSSINEVKYEVEDKVSEWELDDRVRDIAYCDIDDIKNDLDIDIDYSEIADTVFDLVIQEIEHRDMIQELVEQKLEAITNEARESEGTPLDITEIVEDVVEQLINKLRA